ncbi:M23 family metallopeptidase [Microbacteriaceae bacterium VKM Ac-2854]|nr:M23 family metallopeptidase [Microbacteriaceae bacterium VKM Ac-2854]
MQIIHCARGRITTRFHEDIGRGFPHRGIDLGHGDATADDLRILAPAAGRVIAVGRDGTYGLRIIIDHGAGWTTLIAHLASCRVAVGYEVAQGEDIAVMGNSGTEFVHAHQELRLDGVWKDPELYTTTTAGINPQTGDDDVSFADPIKHNGVDAPAVVVLADTLIGVQEAVGILRDLRSTDHRDIHAPADVVDADTLTGVQQTGQRITRLEVVVGLIAQKLGVEVPTT